MVVVYFPNTITLFSIQREEALQTIMPLWLQITIPLFLTLFMVLQGIIAQRQNVQDKRLDDFMRDNTAQHERLTEKVFSTNINLIERIESVKNELTDRVDTVNKQLDGKIETVNKDLTDRIETVNKEITDKIETVNKDLTDRIETVNKEITDRITNNHRELQELLTAHLVKR